MNAHFRPGESLQNTRMCMHDRCTMHTSMSAFMRVQSTRYQMNDVNVIWMGGHVRRLCQPLLKEMYYSKYYLLLSRWKSFSAGLWLLTAHDNEGNTTKMFF